VVTGIGAGSCIIYYSASSGGCSATATHSVTVQAVSLCWHCLYDYGFGEPVYSVGKTVYAPDAASARSQCPSRDSDGNNLYNVSRCN
jgi:hypothetical protein